MPSVPLALFLPFPPQLFTPAVDTLLGETKGICAQVFCVTVGDAVHNAQIAIQMEADVDQICG